MNLVQRLQQLAEPGQTVLSEATWAAPDDPPAGAQELAPQLVKGRETPVLSYRIGRRRCRCLPARSDIMTMTDTDSEPLDRRGARGREPGLGRRAGRSGRRRACGLPDLRAGHCAGAGAAGRRPRRSGAGSSSPSWDRRAAASRRCSTSSPASTSPTRGPSRSPARRSPATTRTSSPSCGASTSGSSSSSSTCSRA